MQEWETHMSDFVPADMLTFDVAPRFTEVSLSNKCFLMYYQILFEDIKVLPSRIRGAYFVSSNQNSDIDFTVKNQLHMYIKMTIQILDPKKKTVFRRNSKKEGIFYFEAPFTGTYTFIFNNRKVQLIKNILYYTDI